jgi:ribosomal-protein-alanine N-acetyltransferase
MSIYAAIQNLETKRLLLRQFIASDAEDVLSFKAQDRSRTHRIENVTNANDALAFVKSRMSYLADRKGMAWAITPQSGAGCMGSIELTRVSGDDKAHVREIGFYLGIPFRGNGYATEAIQSVVSSAFRVHDDLQRIHAEVEPRNSASINALKNSGFLHEGILKSWNMGEVDGFWKPIDLAVLSLTRDLWSGTPAMAR